MAFDAEKEIAKLWAKCQAAQTSIRNTHYTWRQAAIEMAGDGADEEAIAMKGWETQGKDTAKTFFPRLDVTKPNFVERVGRLFVGHWRNQGALVRLEKGEDDNEVFIIWDRCPWPTWAKNFGAPMEEDAKGCHLFLETIVEDVALFTNKNLKIETQKAIPRGEGACVRRLYLEG